MINKNIKNKAKNLEYSSTRRGKIRLFFRRHEYKAMAALLVIIVIEIIFLAMKDK